MDPGTPRTGILLGILLAITVVLAPAAAGANHASPEAAVSLGLVAYATAEPSYAGSNFPTPLAPVRTYLNATASGGLPPYSYRWEFGDGSNLHAQDAIHVYSLAGRYAARVTVIDSGGLAATSTVMVGVDSDDGVHWITAMPTPTLGSVPLPVTFAVTGKGEMPQRYDWSFGDGGSSADSAPAHTYSDSGMYVANLTVTYPDAPNASYRMTVVADGTGSFDALATSSIVGMCFRDVWNVASLNASVGGGVAHSYLWDFGEGQARSTDPNSTYSFRTFGFHLVSLTVVGADGRTATSSTVVTAVLPPCPMRVFPIWATLLVAGVLTAAGMAAVAFLGRRRVKRRPSQGR